MEYYKLGFRFCRENSGKVLALSLFYSAPLFLISFLISYFFKLYYALMLMPFFGNFAHFAIQIITLSLAELPFIYLAYQWRRNREVSLLDLLSSLFDKMFPVYVMSACYALIVIIGSIFLFIPGLLLMVLFFVYPYVAVIEEARWLKGFSLTYQIGKKNFFSILGVAFVFCLLEIVVAAIGIAFAIYATGSLLIAAMVKIGLNVIFLPYITAVFTYFYEKWAGLEEESLPFSYGA